MRFPTIHTKVAAGSWKSILKPEEVVFFNFFGNISLQVVWNAYVLNASCMDFGPGISVNGLKMPCIFPPGIADAKKQI